MLDSMRCTKCGLTQLAAPTCRSCGTASGKTGKAPILRVMKPAASPAKPMRTAKPTPPAESDEPTVITSSGSEEPTMVASGVAPSTAFDEPTTVAAAAAVSEDSRRLSFAGRGGTLFGIQIVNAFLTVLTLGIYYFWGKVRVRAYLLSQTEFEGDRFAYHGTGKELLFGSMKAGLVFGALAALLNSAFTLPGGLTAQITVFVSAYLLILLLIPVAIVGSRRYRLSRISWRNIRFSFRGSVKAFIPIFVGGALLTGLTFGLYYPFFATARHAFLVSNSFLGDQTFSFNGRGRDLFGPYLAAILLTIPTLGLCWVWFLARKQRYWWDHTSFGTARFRSTITGGRLLGLHAGNLAILILTLGLGWAWVKVRRARFELDNLLVEGQLDLAAIQQEAQTATATGEGLDLLLDMDSGLATG